MSSSMPGSTNTSAIRPRRGSRRAPGRPPRGADDQRARLLDAALACFCAHGINGSSLRAIALQAKVTPALVHYYFAGKPALTEAVLDERLMPILAALREQLDALPDHTPGPALVLGFVGALQHAIAEHPWLPTLWLREVVGSEGQLRLFLRSRIAALLPQPLLRRLALAQQRGELHPQLDPRLLIVSMIGLTLFPAAMTTLWQPLLGAQELDGTALAQHTQALLLHGLGGQGKESGA